MKDVCFHILLVVLLKMCSMSPSSQIPLHSFGYLWLFDKGKKNQHDTYQNTFSFMLGKGKGNEAYAS